MIKKFTFGTPIETDAVLIKQPNSTIPIPYLNQITYKELLSNSISRKKDNSTYEEFFNEDSICFTYDMEDSTQIYGLGEQVRGMNKRGWIYQSCCKDNGDHIETTSSLYASHNFFLVCGGKDLFGVFLDFPGIVNFDMGYKKLDRLSIEISNPNFTLYIIEGTSPRDIIKQFRHIIGRSYIAPLWAYGYQQSRYSYMSSDEVREVAKKHEELGLGLDAIYLDIDYMERYKDFTYNKDTFGDLKELTDELQEKNLHLVPIIDAAVKIEDGYSVYEEGVANNYFCKDENGNDFVAGVWPGKVHFPDVLNEKAREWFGNQYQALTDLGIDGFWNDMNEPAIFYSEENLNYVLEKITGYKGTNLDIHSYFEMVRLVVGLLNNPDDYKRFYHKMTINGEDKIFRHDLVHNLYGYFMTRAAKEAFDRMYPNKRLLLFSRSSYVGMHRYGGLWTGDNYSWWSHMKLLLSQLPAINMCGFIYTGCDVGGFQDNTTKDLMMRWLAFSLFVPLMRNHSDCHSDFQELYRFENQEIFRNLLKIRYAMVPYLYSECVKACLNDDLVYCPLAFEWPNDSLACETYDQLLVGESIMIAPIMEQNKTGRFVYLPEEMMQVSMKSDTDYSTKILPAGVHYIHADLDTVVFFIRKNHMIVLGKGVLNTSEISPSDFTTLGFSKENTPLSYTCYFDDGYSKDYENPNHYISYTF